MPKRETRLLIDDIIDCCEAIFEYTGNVDYEAFSEDRKTREATFRNFEVIGEAAKLTPLDFKLQYPLIEWRLMSDFRNVLIHDYFGVDYEKVWAIIHDELPHNYELLKRIQF